jgi:hypothetical protein
MVSNRILRHICHEVANFKRIMANCGFCSQFDLIQDIFATKWPTLSESWQIVVFVLNLTYNPMALFTT